MGEKSPLNQNNSNEKKTVFSHIVNVNLEKNQSQNASINEDSQNLSIIKQKSNYNSLTPTKNYENLNVKSSMNFENEVMEMNQLRNENTNLLRKNEELEEKCIKIKDQIAKIEKFEKEVNFRLNRTKN